MKNTFKISKRNEKQNFENEAQGANKVCYGKFIRKLKKDIKRNNINCFSCYNNSFINFSRYSFKFNNRTKWNIK